MYDVSYDVIMYVRTTGTNWLKKKPQTGGGGGGGAGVVPELPETTRASPSQQRGQTRYCIMHIVK